MTLENKLGIADSVELAKAENQAKFLCFCHFPHEKGVQHSFLHIFL